MLSLKTVTNPLRHFRSVRLSLARPSCGYPFTLSSRKKQLILHSDGEIEKMHLRNSNKDKKNWQTIQQQNKKQFRVSLVGLPNTGKSTLFNCLIGEHLAIVDKLADLTRDRKEYDIMDGLVRVIDTPGVQVSVLGKKASMQSIKQDIFKQTLLAIHESDLIIVVIDGKKAISNDQIELVKYLRKFGNDQKLILACNKCQNLYDEGQLLTEISKLGINEHFICSGQEGTGIFQILNYVYQLVPQQMKLKLEVLKSERAKKFQSLVDKLKQQMKTLQMTGVKIKEWENDFRKINPDPELNEDLDEDNFQDYFIKPEQAFAKNRGTQIKNLKMKNSIKISFIGRPNVGKSSLINELLGEDRLVVSDVAHTTRDTITTKIAYKGRKIELIDTAGLNTPNFDRNEEQYLKKVQISTMLHVKQSHIVVYVMDAFSAFKIEDFRLMREVIKEGRPIIIAVNKWEAIKQQFKYKAKNYLKKQIDQNLGYQLNGYPLVFVSAKLNIGLNEMMDGIITAYDKWNTRISTGMLNDWLSMFKKLDNLPKDKQMTLKINYLIQARVRPPHFIFFVNSKNIFKDNYLRFVTENMSKEFKMDGIPLRISLRSSNNNENKIKEQKNRKERKPKKVSPMKVKMEELKKKYDNFGL